MSAEKLSTRLQMLALAQKCRLRGSMGLTVCFEPDAAVGLAELLEALVELAESKLTQLEEPNGIGH